MNERDPDQDILDEYERRIAAGTDLEGLEPANISVSPTARATFSIRLSREEFEAFNEAAKVRRMTLSDFLRSSARAAIAGQIDPEKAAAAERVREKARELVEAASQL